MPNTPKIIDEDLVDEVPRGPDRPRPPTKYQHHVEDVLSTGKTKAITCADRTSAEAVQAGVKRAVRRTGANIRVTTQVQADSKVKVYVEPLD